MRAYTMAMTLARSVSGRRMLGVVARLIVAGGLLVGLAAVSGCGTGGSGEEVTGSTKLAFYSVTWVDDSIFFLESGADADSDSATALVRVRAGGRPERIAVAPPSCHNPEDVDTSASALVALGQHDLGQVVPCSDSVEPGRAALVRMNVRDDSTTPVVTIDYDGWGVAWAADAGIGYARAHSCGGGGIRAFMGSEVECFGGAEARFPVAAANGGVVYLTTRCGTGHPEPSGTYAVCRHDGPGLDSTLRHGVRNPRGLAAHGDRLAVAGEIDGKTGLWLLDGGKVRRLAVGDYRDLAVAPDGGNIAAVLRDEGLFSTRWSLRVLSMPPR